MEAVLENLSGWAQEVFLVDSCSSDATVDIALRYGVHVVQRKFNGFGNQWNFALERLPITASWTMKLDPDERLTEGLKASIEESVARRDCTGFAFARRLWFMGRPLPVRQDVVRVWRTGHCRFTDVAVNEHPLVSGKVERIRGELEHHDSPDLHHWFDKQNRYTTAEAVRQYEGRPLAYAPKLFGSSLERRMWLKENFWRMPGRYLLLYLYHLVFLGAWHAGRVGFIWARLRVDVYRMWGYKYLEMRLLGRVPGRIPSSVGEPDPRVPFFE